MVQKNSKKIVYSQFWCVEFIFAVYILHRWFLDAEINAFNVNFAKLSSILHQNLHSNLNWMQKTNHGMNWSAIHTKYIKIFIFLDFKKILKKIFQKSRIWEIFYLTIMKNFQILQFHNRSRASWGCGEKKILKFSKSSNAKLSFLYFEFFE